MLGARRLLESLLEGDLYSGGPSFDYQPSIKELQKIVLMLAIDLAARMGEANEERSLLVEAIAWFPSEPVFWMRLATEKNSGIKAIFIQKIALQNVAKLLPLQRELLGKIVQVDAFLGRSKEVFDCPVEWTKMDRASDLGAHRIEIEPSMPLSKFLEKVCELLDTLETKKGKYHYSGGLKLSVLVEIVVSNSISDASLQVDDTALQLSQAGSIKNLTEYSQHRSQRKRTKGKEINMSEPGLSREELATRITGVLQSFAPNHKVEKLINDAATFRVKDPNRRKGFFVPVDQDVPPFDPPIATLISPGEKLFAAFLIDLLILIEGYSDKPFPATTCLSIGKLISGICSLDISLIILEMDSRQLFWIAEKLLALDERASLSYLIPRLRCKLNPILDKSLFLKYLWINYRMHADPQKLQQVEAIMLSCFAPGTTFKLHGTLDGKQVEILDMNILKMEQRQLKQIVALEHAKFILQSNATEKTRQWLDSELKDPIEWLKRNLSFSDFADWILLLWPHLAKQHEYICFIYGFLSALMNPEGEALLKYTKLSAQFPSCLGSLAKDPEFVNVLSKTSSLMESLEFVEAFSSFLIDKSAIEEHAELFILLLCDLSALETLRDSKLFENIARSLDTTNLSRAGMILYYCSLSLLVGAPMLDPKDEWGLIKSCDRFKLTQQVTDAEILIRLQKVGLLLAEDNADTLKIIAFCEYLVAMFFSLLDKDPLFQFNVQYMWNILEGSANTLPLPLAYVKHPHISSAIIDLFEAKEDALSRLPSSTKKKRASESNASVRSEVVRILCLQTDKEEKKVLLFKLYKLYDTELRHLLQLDASQILSKSTVISAVVLGLHNCACRSDPEELSLSLLEKFYGSISSGLLSWFVNGDAKREIAKALSILIKAVYGERWLSLRLIIHQLKLLARDVVVIARLHVKTLAAYLKKEECKELVLYWLICQTIGAVWALPSDSDSFLLLHGEFIEIISNTLSYDDINLSQSLAEQCLSIISEISKFDRKHVNHAHLFLQTQLSSQRSLENVKQAWAKLIPILAKPKASQLMNVWQTEQEYMGDFYYYCDFYMRKAVETIANCDGPVLEKAKLIAMLIGRISSATNLFIKRKSLLKALYANLRILFPKNLLATDSLVEFQDADDIFEQLENIITDAEEVIRANGVDLCIDSVQ